MPLYSKEDIPGSKDYILHYLTGPIQTNTYVYVSDGKALVIDPAGEGAQLAQELVRDNIALEMVVATHGHGDHVGGVAGVLSAADVPFMMHAQDVDAACRCAHDREIPLPVDDDAPKPSRLLAEGDTVAVGSARFRVIETPGHTPGGICFVGEASASGVAFVGDTLFQGSVGRTDLPGGNARQLLASVRRLSQLLDGACRIYPGHGPATTMETERMSNPFLSDGAEAYLGL